MQRLADHLAAPLRRSAPPPPARGGGRNAIVFAVLTGVVAMVAKLCLA